MFRWERTNSVIKKSIDTLFNPSDLMLGIRFGGRKRKKVVLLVNIECWISRVVDPREV